MRCCAIRAAVAAALFLGFFAGALHAETLDSLKKTYGAVGTVEAHFRQKIAIKAVKREREMEGDFFYKRSKGFLWRYTAPTKKVFLYDGAAIWQAEGDKPYVTRDKIDREKMEGSFLDLVDDVTRLDKLFRLTGSAGSDGMEVLDLAPKKEGTLQSARIFVDGRGVIRRIEITEITGNTNIIDFSSIKLNAPLSDRLFVFKPDGLQVIDSKGERAPAGAE